MVVSLSFPSERVTSLQKLGLDAWARTLSMVVSQALAGASSASLATDEHARSHVMATLASLAALLLIVVIHVKGFATGQIGNSAVRTTQVSNRHYRASRACSSRSDRC